MRPRTLLRAAVLSTALLAASTTSADGAQHCVGPTGGTCDHSYPFDAAGVAAAVTAAGAAGADEVRIAAGAIIGVTTLTLPSQTTITGAGGEATTLVAQPGSSPLIDMPGASAVADLALTSNGTGIGIRASGAAGHPMERVRLSGFANGITAISAVLNVRESVVALGTVANARGISVSGGDTSAYLDRLTIAGRGTAQTGVFASAPADKRTDAWLRDSVVYLTGGGATKSLVCNGSGLGGAADLTVQRVAFSPSAQYTASGANCDTTPSSLFDLFSSSLGFVDEAAGDYRLVSYSGLIDRGTTSAPLQTTDLAGGARFVDGDGNGTAAVDLGAYEYQHRPPTPPAISVPATTVPPGTALAFSASSTDPDPGDYVQLSWNFGDGTSSNSDAPLHAYAALGTYVATATATDPAGLTSTAQVQITVANPAGPGDPGAVPTPTPLDPFFTATGPRVRVLAAPSRAVRRSSSGFATVGAAAADVATLETAGAITLRVSLTRLMPGRRSGSRCKAGAKRGKRCTARVPISAIGQIPVSPGVAYLRFGGKLGGRRLPKGAYEVRILPVGIDKKKGAPATYALKLR